MQLICPPDQFHKFPISYLRNDLTREGRSQHNPQPQLRIIDGEPARRGMFPYAATFTKAPTSVFSERRAHCGATLISPRHLITAAHCTSSLTERVTVLIDGVCTRRTLWDGCSKDGKEVMRSVEIDFIMSEYYESTTRFRLQKFQALVEDGRYLHQ